ncbi:MAG: DUF1778 domain-containing protein [Sphingomonadaceae bacterium]|nr:DUF1778 domain-containing protein [Sphingomonadaceae bacterium]
MPAAARLPKRETFNIRVPAETKRLVESAAAARGQTVSEFVIDSARERANEVLLDRTLIVLADEQYAAFVAALDNPPPPTDQLTQLLRTEPSWLERD